MTCLHYAAKFGRIDVIKYILDTETVDVNSSVRESERFTCLQSLIGQFKGGWKP